MTNSALIDGYRCLPLQCHFFGLKIRGANFFDLKVSGLKYEIKLRGLKNRKKLRSPKIFLKIKIRGLIKKSFFSGIMLQAATQRKKQPLKLQKDMCFKRGLKFCKLWKFYNVDAKVEIGV